MSGVIAIRFISGAMFFFGFISIRVVVQVPRSLFFFFAKVWFFLVFEESLPGPINKIHVLGGHLFVGGHYGLAMLDLASLKATSAFGGRSVFFAAEETREGAALVPVFVLFGGVDHKIRPPLGAKSPMFHV